MQAPVKKSEFLLLKIHPRSDLTFSKNFHYLFKKKSEKSPLFYRGLHLSIPR
jgi:hypothetical protein